MIHRDLLFVQIRQVKLHCFILCMVAVTVQANETNCQLSPDHPLINATNWYGGYYEDTKVGNAVETIELRTTADYDVISYHFEATFKFEQSEETITETRNFDITPPHRLIDGSYHSADRNIAYDAKNGNLLLMEDGQLRVWEDIEYTLCDIESVALYRFLKLRPEIGAQIKTSNFDVGYQALIESTHTLEAISTRRIYGTDHLFHTLLTASDNDTFSYKGTSQYRNGEAISFLAGPIEFRNETEATARQPNAAVDLFAEFEKPLNRPLINLEKIVGLKLKVHVTDPTVNIDDVVQDGFMQRVQYVDDKTAIIRLGNYDTPPENGEIETFLKPTSVHPSDHPRIHALATKIRASVLVAADDQALVEAILSFVAGYIETTPASPYDYNTTSVFDTLDNRIGDCTEFSQLFITLARAMEIPAREVTGYIYGGDDNAPSLTGHAWVEVFVDGKWIGLDPTWEETFLNRSHLQIKNDLVLGMSFEVIDIKYE